MSDSTTQKNRKQLLIIFAIAALSTIIPYVMFVTGWGIPSETKNKGILITKPDSLTEFAFEDMAGNPWKLSEQTAKFRLVFLLDRACDDVCKEQLHISRQVHIRLGRESDQLQRLLVFLDYQPDEELLGSLKEEHPRLLLLKGNRENWLTMLANHPELTATADAHEYYILHRYNALVMAYTPKHTGTELLDDMKFLIKTSN